MSFRTLLLASAAVMVAGAASAKDMTDFTNPFYLPVEGKVLSDTRVDYGRLHIDTGSEEAVSEKMHASEEVTVGLGNGFALTGRIGNTFDEEGEFNNDHNFDYAVGAKYNHDFGKVMTQVAASFSAYDPQSFYGQAYGDDNEKYNDRWEKSIDAHVMVGYDAGCITPYTKFAVEGDIDTDSNEQEYTWSLGVHKTWEKASADVSVNYVFGEFDFDDDNVDGNNKIEEFYLNGEANFFVKENIALGIYGSYYLGGDYHKDIDNGYEAGLSARVLF
jgi:hypothetical protein